MQKCLLMLMMSASSGDAGAWQAPVAPAGCGEAEAGGAGRLAEGGCVRSPTASMHGNLFLGAPGLSSAEIMVSS